MKKRKKQQKNTGIEAHNLVAKHAHNFNKAVVFKDKSKYQRKAKHNKLEAFFMSCTQGIKKAFSTFHMNIKPMKPILR